MLIRGLLVAASGFLFIFAPGLPIYLLTRPATTLPRDGTIWGMGVWLVALFPALFFQSLVRQIAQGGQAAAGNGQPTNQLLTLLSALIGAFFLVGLLYLALRLRRRRQSSDLLPDGLALGFGVGLIAQVFTGLNLVGAGFRLTFGDSSGTTLSGLAHTPFAALGVSLLALVLFRLALLAVSGLLGVLAARAVAGTLRFLWLALALETAFHWLILPLQAALGGESPGLILAGKADLATSLASVAYYALAFALAYRWLRGAKMAAPSSPVLRNPS